jgi:hypothetical protein
MEHTRYIPGVCNIGPEERQARRRVGWLGLGITVVAWILLAYLRPGQIWYLVIFLSASVSASGFIQDRMHFCANFGMRHVFNFSASVGKVETIMEKELWSADRLKALKIGAYSVGTGLLVTLVMLVLASLLSF